MANISEIVNGGLAPRQTRQTPTVKPVAQQFGFYTPQQAGVPTSYVDNYNVDTVSQLAGLRAQYDAQAQAANAGSGAQAAGLKDRLNFGLQGIDLQRQLLGLDRNDLGLARESLGLDQQTADLNRRDAMEGVINNALQRGIYNSGIRIRNEQRAGERADIADERLKLQGEGLENDEGRLDVNEKQLDLNEKELRSSIKTALASMNAQSAANRRLAQSQLAAAQEQLEMQRRQYLGELVMQYGGIYSDASIMEGSYEDVGRQWIRKAGFQ